MKNITLHTNRLILRQATTKDTKDILRFYTDNRDFLEPYEPYREENFYTKSFQKQQIKWDIQTQNTSGSIRFWLYLKDYPEQTIGVVALNNIIRGIMQSCSIGYKMDYRFLRQGYMTEAVQATIEYGFSILKLHRIEADIMPRNTASIALVKKLNFHYEGLSPAFLMIHGVWEDHLRYSLLSNYE